MKEPVKKYLKKIIVKWNKYEEFSGIEALSFKNDIEMLLTYWNERVVTEKEIRLEERKKTLEEVKRDMFIKVGGDNLLNINEIAGIEYTSNPFIKRVHLKNGNIMSIGFEEGEFEELSKLLKEKNEKE